MVRASEMVQWVKVLPAKSNGLSSIPRIHVLEGENWPLPWRLSYDLHMYTGVHTDTQTDTQSIDRSINQSMYLNFKMQMVKLYVIFPFLFAF